MRTWMLIVVAAVAALVVAPTRASADETMRCPTGRIVRVGDRLLQLAQICGAPDATDHHTVLRELGARARTGPLQDEERVVVEVRIEEWLYDLGPGRLLRRLVFEDGRLIRIETLGRGRR